VAVISTLHVLMFDTFMSTFDHNIKKGFFRQNFSLKHCEGLSLYEGQCFRKIHLHSFINQAYIGKSVVNSGHTKTV